MKNFSSIIIVFVVLLICTSGSVFAQSSYVLPYPSSMPGSASYKLHLFWEDIVKYWYFGNFGQFTYSLKQADKYLVEAKTLFEYKQYLLGVKALQKSDTYFVDTLPHLLKAKAQNKDINSNRNLLREAALKHIEVLIKLKKDIPEVFTWSPEKSSSTVLELTKIIDRAIKIRQNHL